VQNGHGPDDSMKVKKRKGGRLGGGKSTSLDRYLACLLSKTLCPCPSCLGSLGTVDIVEIHLLVLLFFLFCKIFPTLSLFQRGALPLLIGQL
jgi:hypothetical protein